MNELRPSQHPRREQSFPTISSAQLGMYVALASLSMLFGASLIAYFITRAQSEVWVTEQMPHLPGGVWLSTGLLTLLSVCLHVGLARLRKNDFSGLERYLLLAFGLSLAFLLAQVQNWRAVAAADLVAPVKSLYSYTFYMLTALHALHVLAGVFPFVWVLFKARRQHYSSSNSEGVRLLIQYWDFLFVVWLVLLGALWLAT